MQHSTSGTAGRAPAARSHTVLLFVILVLGGVLRLYAFHSPPLDYHSFRQAQTLMMARNYYELEPNLLLPHVDWFSTQRSPGMHPAGNTELGVTPWLTAHLYRIFGVSHGVARVVPMVLALLATYYFFLLAQRLYGPTASLSAALLMTFSPMFFELGRVQMPDMFAIAMTVFGFYYFRRWREDGGGVNYWLGAAGIMLMLLGKSTYIVNGLGLLYLAKEERRWNEVFKDAKLLGFGALVLSPLLLFSYFSSLLAHSSGIAFGVPQLFEYHLLLRPSFWSENLWRLGWWCLTPAGAVLAGAGAVLAWRTDRLFPLVWLCGALTTYLLLPGGALSNPHYLLVCVAPAALLAALALERLRTLPRARLLLPLLIALIALPALGEMRALSRPTILADDRCAAWLRDNTNEEDLVLVRNDNPAMLYLADRKGWIPWVEEGGEPQVFSFDLINTTVSRGARYLAITNPALRLEPQPVDPFASLHYSFTDTLYSAYVAHHGEGFVVFQLNKRPVFPLPGTGVIDFSDVTSRQFLRGVSSTPISGSPAQMKVHLLPGETMNVVVDAPPHLRTGNLRITPRAAGVKAQILINDAPAVAVEATGVETTTWSFPLPRREGQRLSIRCVLEGGAETSDGIEVHELRLTE